MRAADADRRSRLHATAPVGPLVVGPLVVASVLGLAGCSGAPAPRAVGAEQFWRQVAPVPAEEVDPATSLEELEDRSTVVVRASVESVSAGPVDVDVQPQGDVRRTSTVLTLKVAEWVTGRSDRPVRVWLSSEYPGDGAAVLPEGESLWFLRPSDRPDLLLMTALSGVIGTTSRGALVTLRDPSQTDAVVPDDVSSIRELEDELG